MKTNKLSKETSVTIELHIGNEWYEVAKLDSELVDCLLPSIIDSYYLVDAYLLKQKGKLVKYESI